MSGLSKDRWTYEGTRFQPHRNVDVSGGFIDRVELDVRRLDELGARVLGFGLILLQLERADGAPVFLRALREVRFAELDRVTAAVELVDPLLAPLPQARASVLARRKPDPAM